MSTQAMLTIHSSAASSFTSGAAIVFFVRARSRAETRNCRRGIHSGMCEGASFWKKKSPCHPSGYRFIVNGRSLRCGTSTGATAR